ncbi:hypothetical protein IFR05_008575 [Cadophora sp. M221]|nr:hypothetical protein IFR05_008575 [Cadophora sp. M221]
MRITIFSVLVLSISRFGQVVAGSFLAKKAIPTVAAPDCSLTCLGTLIPQHCDSLTDTICICTNTDLAAVLLPCAISACNITDSLQLARYQAEVCDVPNDMTRYWLQIHTYCVLVPVTAIFVALRIFARVRLNIGLGAQVQRALRFFYISELLYLCAITFTKLSLLLFFRRIFPGSSFRIATVCVGVFIIASNIALFMALAFQCMPIHGVWTNWMYKVPPVKCINVFAVVYVAAGMSIMHDIMILCMPIPILIGLNLETRKKANLMVMFGVGSFVVVASVIRLPSLMKMGNSSDPSFDQAPVAFWTNLETSVGIICACLPACRSLIGFYFPRLKMSLNNTSSNGHKTPTFTNTASLNTKEYFSKKRATRDSFLELDDRSRTGSEEELQGKNNKSKSKPTTIDRKKSLTTKTSDRSHSHSHDHGDGDSILHIQSNSNTPIQERFVPADRKGFGHMATVVVGNPLCSKSRGKTGSGSPDSVNSRAGREIVLTRTLDQSTTLRL